MPNQETQIEKPTVVIQNNKVNPFNQFRNETPENFLGSPIFSTNLKQYKPHQLNRQLSVNLPLRINGETPSQPLSKRTAGVEKLNQKNDIGNKKECFRLRRPSQDIQPEMRFSLKSYIKAKKADEANENKSRHTFVAAIQTFYNKIDLVKHAKENHSMATNEPCETLEPRKSTKPQKAKQANDTEQEESRTDNRKNESMNYLSELAKTVLNRYQFFPQKQRSFLMQGEGKVCSNPLTKNKEVYQRLLRETN